MNKITQRDRANSKPVSQMKLQRSCGAAYQSAERAKAVYLFSNRQQEITAELFVLIQPGACAGKPGFSSQPGDV